MEAVKGWLKNAPRRCREAVEDRAKAAAPAVGGTAVIMLKRPARLADFDESSSDESGRAPKTNQIDMLFQICQHPEEMNIPNCCSRNNALSYDDAMVFNCFCTLFLFVCSIKCIAGGTTGLRHCILCCRQIEKPCRNS